jgi:hypothetical protein
MRRALVGSDRLGPGCLVLRADTRENPGGKNGVMTEARFINIGAYLSLGPVSIIIGTSSFTRPISANFWDLLLHEAHFYKTLGLTPPRGPFQHNPRDLLLSRGPFG